MNNTGSNISILIRSNNNGKYQHLLSRAHMTTIIKLFVTLRICDTLGFTLC